MAFYDLTKSERRQKYNDIQADTVKALFSGETGLICGYFDDADTYIRKAAYLAIGKIYVGNKELQGKVIPMLETLMANKSERVRQTVINSAGEIAVKDFAAVEHIFERGLKDDRHSVKNAVQGSLKKSGEKNPQAIIAFCRRYVHDANPEIRRQVIHGLELRGRKHPEDILPLLRQLQFEKHKRVRPMLIHILGQISYKKGCLEKVTAELITWEDKALARDCFNEIIEQNRHANSHFGVVETLSPTECEEYIKKHFSIREE